MSTQEARIVKAHIDDKGTVEEIDDPFYHHFWDPDTRLDRALEEEHYGWTLKPLLENGITVAPVFPGTVDICTNDPDDTSHLNTIAAQRPELVKLDVGYWGDYTRENPYLGEPKRSPPQRNFGMIQGRDVWLCNYSGSAAASGNKPLPEDDSPAGKLLKYLSDKGLNVDIIMHALAPSTPFTQDLDPETLYLLFSDLHLPERFPDAPYENKRAKLPDSELRKELREELRSCQHEFGLLAGNRTMDEKTATFIQKYLEDISHGSRDNFVITDSGVFSSKSFTYTPDNVLAEKNILDRTIRTRSCWFYGPSDGNKEDGDHEKKSDPAKMSAGPSVDLATFLAAVLKVKNDGANLKVIQLGDLYELWMGREFLYLDFPVTNKFDTLSLPRATLSILQSWAGENDEFQYRFDEEWSDGKNIHDIKRYPFHQWAKSDMIKRHKTGWDYLTQGAVDNNKLAAEVPPKKLERVLARLAERGKNVEEFSLPIPASGCGKLQDVLADVDLDLETYKRSDAEPGDICPLPENEYRWHRLIFDLFLKLDFQNIHGNHDGYRSDPVLRGSISIPAQEWISIPGIWIEHGHRWDEFNRDGCAIGAGMTNMVYYHNKEMLDADRTSTVKEWFMPQDQKCFLPGAAQWYLLVNMTNNEFKSRDGSQPVFPFGIIVVGHTHHPDLCYIRYEKEGSWLSAAVGAVTAAAEKVVEAGKKVEKFVSDKLKQAEDALAKAKAKLKAAEEELAKAKAKAESAIGDAKQKALDALNKAKAEATEAANKAKAAAEDALNKVKAAEAEVEKAKVAVADAAAKAQAAAANAAKEAGAAASNAANQAKSAIPGKPPIPGTPKLPF